MLRSECPAPGLPARHVSEEDSLSEPRPRLESWSSTPRCGAVSFSMHTEPSSLHTRDTELFRTVHITCVPTGHLQEAISSFLSFFPSFISFLPFLQMSQNPMSNLTEATVLKSSHQELAHSPALTDVCRLLWFQGKAKK